MKKFVSLVLVLGLLMSSILVSAATVEFKEPADGKYIPPNATLPECYEFVNVAEGRVKQINPWWRFGYMPVDGKVKDFVEHSIAELRDKEKKLYWLMSVLGSVGTVDGGIRMGDYTWPSTDYSIATAIVFTSPKDGDVTIDSLRQIRQHMEPNSNPNGAKGQMKILRNDTQIWPEKGYYETTPGEFVSFPAFDTTVKKGDKLVFIFKMSEEGTRANLDWMPTVEYLFDLPTPDDVEDPVVDTPKDPVQDVKITDIEGNWAKDFATNLVSKGIMMTKNGAFEPTRAIKREEFAQSLMLAFNLVDNNATVEFTDVPVSADYYTAIASAKKLGIVNGVSDTAFGTGATITRQDMATMIFRAVKYKNIELKKANEAVSFADASSINDYAKDAVTAMQTAGIVNGVGDNKFAPNDNATRDAVAKILSMLLEYVK